MSFKLKIIENDEYKNRTLGAMCELYKDDEIIRTKIYVTGNFIIDDKGNKKLPKIYDTQIFINLLNFVVSNIIDYINITIHNTEVSFNIEHYYIKMNWRLNIELD